MGRNPSRLTGAVFHTLSAPYRQPNHKRCMEKVYES